MKSTRRTVVALVLALLAALVVALPASQPAMAAAPLTNLAHLDWLGDQVTPPAQAGHTTYRIDSEPELGVLWTYADRRADGLYHRVGGGGLKPDGVNWKQGAFNADDVSRAAVVYLRHWQQTGSTTSQRQGRTRCCAGWPTSRPSTGPNAGNVVLWMQPDGTLNPVADPAGAAQTRPTRASPTGWRARPGPSARRYAAFHGSPTRRPGVRGVPRGPARPRGRRAAAPAAGALRHLPADRRRADAGLAGRRRRRRDRRGRARPVGLRRGGWHRPRRGTRCAKLAEGVAADGRRRRAQLAVRRACCRGRSRAVDLARLGLADAGRAGPGLGSAGRRRRSPPPAVRDSATFDPWLLDLRRPGQRPAAHPDRRLADRLRRRLAAAVAARHRRRRPARPGIRRLAGIVAAWYFGANASGQPAYDPATGRPVDGVAGRRQREPQRRRRVDHPRPAVDARARRAPGGRRAGSDRRDRRAGRHRARCRPRPARLAGGAHAVELPAAGPGSRSSAASATSALPAAARSPRRRRQGRAAAGACRGRPAARQHRGHHVPRRRHGARHGPLRRRRARRATHRPRARCCR